MPTTDTVPAVRDLAVRIAGFGLEQSDPMRIPEGSWQDLLSELEIHKLTGLAVAGAEAGWLELEEARLAELMERQREDMVWALGLERTLLDLAAAFDDHGIDFVVLKGPAVAHTKYPDPSWRPFGDLDLLVRTADWRRACDLLGEVGLERRLPEPRRGFDERFGKAAVFRGPKRQEIDLHRTLAQGPFGIWLDADELFGHTTELRLGGRALRRLDDTALLAHACIHAVLGFEQPLLLTVRDVAQVAESANLDWELMGNWAKRWRLGVVFRHAFELISSLWGTPWSVDARPAVVDRPKDRWALEAYTTPRRRRGGSARATVRALPGLRAKAAYVRALMAPGREFVAARSGSGSAKRYLHRWATPVSWMRRERG
jgi:hypothetical protein